MVDTTLQLGDFVFQAYEIPEKIPFGGSQQLVTHKLIGGARVVDAMGRDDMPIAWSGLFYGAAALDRARYVDYLRTTGQVLTLTWSEFNYSVIIEKFECPFERFYKLPYSISCSVVSDNASPTTSGVPSGFDDALTDDMSTANSIGSVIGDSALSGLLNTLNTAIAAVSSFATATQATINSVLIPLAVVQSKVSVLITTTANTLNSVTTIGGILPNNPISTQAANLTNQVVATANLPQLYNLQSVLNRMGGNLGLIGGAPNSQQVTVAGGNLMSIASQYYGDPTKWTALSQANGLVDPVLTGINTIIIPPNPADNGGVLS